MKYSDATRMLMLGKLNSSPLRGNMASPPAAPRIVASVVEQAEHAEENAPPKIPPKLARFFLLPKDLAMRIWYIIMEIVMPESMATAMIDENTITPDASSMFVAPFFVTSKSNFGEALRPNNVTNVEKLLTSMKMKNVKAEIRIDAITYGGFLKTL